MVKTKKTSKSKRMEIYKPDELNSAVDGYLQMIDLINSGYHTEEIVKRKDFCAMEILRMVEPFLLTYFRFLAGYKDHKTKEIKQFLYLFTSKTNKDTEMIAYYIQKGIKPMLATSRSDSSSDEEYLGNDLYSWFQEILFADILPRYQVKYTDSGERINFFRAFQCLFRYALSHRIKKQMGWEGRKVYIEQDENNPYFSTEMRHPVAGRIGVRYDFQWRMLMNIIDTRKVPVRMSKTQRVVLEHLGDLLYAAQKSGRAYHLGQLFVY